MIYRILFFLIVFNAVIFRAYAGDSTQTQQAIDDIIAQVGMNINTGIEVKDADTGEIIYSRNADRSFVPASNQKLFTAYAALAYLGADYRYKTRFLTDNKQIEGGVLQGDLYLQFSGAPDFRVQDLDTMVAKLQKLGIGQIKGDVYVDDLAFDAVQMGPGWMWDDAKYCFSAPIRASILNGNCVTLKAVPSKSSGSRVKIMPAKRNAGVQFRNDAKTRLKNYKNCYLALRSAHDNTYQLSGCLPADSKGRSLSIALQDPHTYAQAILKSLLKNHHIKVNGKVKAGRAKAGSQELVQHQSKTVAKLVKIQLKESDNLISESLLKKIGQLYFRAQGSWRTGVKAIETILKKQMDMDFSHSVIADGGGLSRYNLVSPKQMVLLLTTAYKNSTLAPVFMDALPIGGVDGTLDYRMKGSAARRVMAKTGSMVGVVSLSGYIKTQSNRTLVFSIITNGVPGSLSTYRKVEDQICDYLVVNI